MNIIALIPARAGSTGLPRKNLYHIAGEPLWRRAALQGARSADYAIVTTDIEEISDNEIPIGVSILKRPKSLSLNDTPMSKVVSHAISELNLKGEDVILLLQPTSPLRKDKDITEALDTYASNKFDMVMSVCESNPSILKHGTLIEERFQPLSDAKFCFQNRQSLPQTYRPNGAIYVFSVQSFREASGFPTNRMGVQVMSVEHSEDIDSFDDFVRVQNIISSE